MESWSALTAESKRDLDAVVDGFRAAAEQGSAEAQRNLGFLYKNGRGVAQSDE
jgi:TPR repeat protein